MIAVALDAILTLVVAEALGLVLLHRATGRGLPPRELLPTLAAGFFLMLSARLALTAEPTAPVAACLLASLIAHLVDLVGRWR